jgi:flagella basal body P-ring formation protein FlgA
MTKSQRLRIGLTLCCVAAAQLAGSAAEFQLKPEYVCQRSFVRVGDIVEMSNVRPEEAREIAAIELFAAPAARQTRALRASELRELLTLHGVDLSAVQLRGASEVRIRRGPNPQQTADAGRGSETRTAVGALHARRPIARGEIVRADAVELKPLSSLATRQDYVTSSDVAVGLESIQAIEAGQPIAQSGLRRPLIIARNETVSLVARSAGVHVRTSARALESGTLDDLIAIETLDAPKQKLAARVVAPKTVEIFAGVPVVPATR